VNVSVDRSFWLGMAFISQNNPRSVRSSARVGSDLAPGMVDWIFSTACLNIV
jgi:hypothetical protein